MKYNFLLLGVGVLFTGLYSQLKIQQTPGTKTVQVEKLNAAEFDKLNSYILKETRAAEPTTKVTRNLSGVPEFNSKIEELQSYMKTKQVLFRYDLTNTMRTFIDRSKTLTVNEVPAFNTELTRALERSKELVETIRVDGQVKNDIIEKLNKLKNTVQVAETVVAVHARRGGDENMLSGIREQLKNLKTTEAVQVEVAGHEEYPSPFLLAGIWALLLTGSMALGLKKKKEKIEAVAMEEEDKINPTLKRILLDLEYPLFMVNPGLEVVWKNKRSEELELNTQSIQEIFSNKENTDTAKINGRDYRLIFSELAYKSGKVNHLVQCRPDIVAARHLDHLLDTAEVTAFLESMSQNKEMTFGDVNQTTAQLAVKLGYLFKVSGKFLDIDFKKEMSDCFIEKDRLEKILKEFIMSCHHMIKDQSDVEGIFLRTDEAGNKFSVSCFLSNYRADSLNTNPMARDFLKRFSVLEARYSSCNPSIDFRLIETGDVRGLDISIHFENQSELENMMSNVSASV